MSGPALDEARAALIEGRIIEAFGQFAALIESGDTSRAVLAGHAWACERLGRFDLATASWSAILENEPADPVARWRSLHGEVELGRDGAVAALVEGSLEGEPHDGMLVSAAAAIARARSHASTHAVAARLRHLPGLRPQAAAAAMLVGVGELDAAERVARHVLADLGPTLPAAPSAMLDVARLAAQTGDVARFDKVVETLIARAATDPTAPVIAALKRWLLRPSHLAALRRLVDDLEPRGADPLTDAAIADVLIALGEQDRAARIVADLMAGPAVGSVAVETLRAWDQARRGDTEAARATMLGVLWPNTRHHELQLRHRDPRAVSGVPISAPVVCLSWMHNELHRAESFIEHHRALGVGRFWIVDDRSTDGTREWLMGQPDVDVFTDTASFREAGNGAAWASALAARLAPETWVLSVDADERLVLPPGTDDVDSLVASLGTDVEALHGNVVDTFVGPDGTPWFDTDLIPVGRVQAPYRGLVGGVRYRLLGRDIAPELTKTPLCRADRLQGLWATHDVLPVRVGDVSVACMHHKLESPGSFDDTRAVDDRRQQAQLASRSVMALVPAPCSVRYDGPAQLAALGLVGPQPPIGWAAPAR